MRSSEKAKLPDAVFTLTRAFAGAFITATMPFGINSHGLVCTGSYPRGEVESM
ncbi:MAG: hypothetical protein LC126_12020 [Bryobacterales bacterium]|nr:hypothetical protein [Bryobacterales bacterium]